MPAIQSELLRIGAKIVAEEPIVITEYMARQMYAGWGNSRDFSPGLRIEALFNRRGRDLSLANIASILFEIDDVELGVSQMTVSSDAYGAEAYEGPYGELFLEAFTQYEARPHMQTPAGLSGMTLGLTVVQARDILVT